MRDILWRAIALILSRPRIAAWLISYAKRMPYRDLPGYMLRNWLFNPYSPSGRDTERTERGIRWLPAIRVHHILREDLADHPHDHPWDARTIILRGWYIEQREGLPRRVLRAGDTAPIRFGEFHHIERVSDGGVFTLFFTWDYFGTWGFKVDGAKVPWREYVATHPERA